MVKEYEIPSPVFVFGALRSGTTMFRLMLNSHPTLHNPGEVDFLFDHLKRDINNPTGWRYEREALTSGRIFKAHKLSVNPNIDGLDLLQDMLRQLYERAASEKGNHVVLTLNVHRNIGLIFELMPHSPIIHVLRDPRDVARSCIGMGWVGNSYYGARVWLDAEGSWQEIEHKLHERKVLTVYFEELLRDIRAQLSRVCEFLGVSMRDEMLNYHLNSTYEPPDVKLAQQWRRKSTDREIALIEGRCRTLMEQRGYPVESRPVHPGKVRRFGLAIDNRARRWKHNVNRLGLGLFIARHLVRLPGMGPLRAQVMQKIERDAIARLK